MLRARDGDGQAMGRLLTELSPKLRAYIGRHLIRCGQTDPADAEDLLQVTLIAIHRKQHTYDPAQPLGGWVYAIARYKVVDHLRATQRRRADVPIEDADQIAAPDVHEAAEANWDLSAMLGRLSRQRTRHEHRPRTLANARCGMWPRKAKYGGHR